MHYGKDYHKVIKDKIYVLLEALRDTAGEVSGRVFVDSAPVLERHGPKMQDWVG